MSEWSLSFETSLSVSGFHSSPKMKQIDQKFKFKNDDDLPYLNFDQNQEEYLIPIPDKIFKRFKGQQQSRQFMNTHNSKRSFAVMDFLTFLEDCHEETPRLCPLKKSLSFKKVPSESSHTCVFGYQTEDLAMPATVFYP